MTKSVATRSVNRTVRALLVALPLACAMACLLAISCGKACAAPLSMVSGTVTSLDKSEWLLAPDPKNVGREEKWWEKPQPGAKSTPIPWIIQEILPGYHGVAWYWCDFTPPANPIAGGRYLLRFWAVDYVADVWLNGIQIGHHEGGEEPFVLDVTDVVKPNVANRIAVRVLNPTNEPIDGIVLNQTPRRNKTHPITPGNDYNYGGITDSVELLMTPPVRVEDLFVRADPKTGTIRVQANVRNAGKQAAKGRVTLVVSPASSGESLDAIQLDRELPSGDTLVEAELSVKNPKLWELNDPNLYRVTVRAAAERAASFDERSTRCGFRDFRMQDGYFRLNGKRIYLKSSHTGADTPVGIRVPVDPDLLRKDLLNCKVMGFNMIRFIAGLGRRDQLELCDEIGLLVYEENFASWCLENSPKMPERFTNSTVAMVKRDRNHPSIVMWGLLNETGPGAVLMQAVRTLPVVRDLDDSRVVMLNSGSFDNPSGSDAVGPSMWRNRWALDPNVSRNIGDKELFFDGTTWPAKQLSLHPGVAGEYSAIRWTAPADGQYAINATFHSIVVHGVATTDVHLFHQGKSIFDSFVNLNGHGPKEEFAKTLSIKKGETIDAVVGTGGDKPTGDTTALDMTIKSASGQTFDVAADYNTKQNPNGVWTYGFLPPGEKPDLATFRSYSTGEEKSGKLVIGRISNPGSREWENILCDIHPYQPLPHNAGIIHTLRTVSGAGLPVWLSEYGIGSAIDLAQTTRHYEQIGKTACEDAIAYRGFLDQFMADWQRWNLGDTFANPEDYFQQCLAWMAGIRKLGINAIRANPNVIGYSLTGTQDQGYSGEGLTTTFRDLKPGTIDAMFDAWYPLRWCLFVEPVQVYRGGKAHLEAVLANEDMLAPGEYPVRLQVVGPLCTNILDRTITVKIPDPKGKPEPNFVLPVFAEDLVIDGPSGKYHFLATFEKGGAAAGGDIEFYVADPADMPQVEAEITLWGDDGDLAKWLASKAIKTRAFTAGLQTSREVILVGNRPAAGEADAFRELARHIARGSHVVFLSPEVFQKDNDRTRWLPFANKGGRIELPVWVYHKDDWAKNHPIFDGLQAGGIMDHTFYREILSNTGWNGLDVPAEVVAGSINTGLWYNSGLTMGIWNLGAGRVTLNTLRIRENLGTDPVAERLLRNMLRHAVHNVNKPLAELPADFESQLKAFGY